MTAVGKDGEILVGQINEPCCASCPDYRNVARRVAGNIIVVPTFFFPLRHLLDSPCVTSLSLCHTALVFLLFATPIEYPLALL